MLLLGDTHTAIQPYRDARELNCSRKIYPAGCLADHELKRVMTVTIVGGSVVVVVYRWKDNTCPART